ncbi:MAG: hypothetical protein FJ145_25870 [Deltaproteobacteria bacterium]|nr:hypothetical protein [Deltaproteobacteria bacterium]
MKNLIRPKLSTFIAAVLLSGCASSTYVPFIRDIKEQPIEGSYWFQQFTLYNPADMTADCAISRTGQKLDLNSGSDLADVWRKHCRPTGNPDQRSDSN